MRVIINADDFGFSPAVNAAIADLLRQGRLTSATLLATAPAFSEAVELSRAWPGCSFGVHLCLTAFPPLTNTEVFRQAGLLGGDGCFNGRIRAIRPSRRALLAIRDEWCAQVARVQETGVLVSHLDSHHHVHTIPWLFPALKAVQRRCGIRRVRLSANLYAPTYHPPALRRASKALWNACLRRILVTRTTDYFGPVAVFDELASQGRLPSATSTYELMAHPGHAAYDGETAILMRAPTWLRAGIVCGYSEL